MNYEIMNGGFLTRLWYQCLLVCLFASLMTAVSSAQLPSSEMLFDGKKFTLTGVVKQATFVGGHQKVIKMFQEGEAEPFRTTYSVDDTWFVVLHEVKGMDAESLTKISKMFMISYPSDPITSMFGSDAGAVVLKFSGKKLKDISVGKKLVLKSCSFGQDLLGITMDYESASIK